MPEHRVNRLFHWWRGKSILGVLTRILAIAVAAVVLTLLLPGWVAYRGHVFYREDMVKVLRGEAKAKLLAFEQGQAKQRQLLAKIDADIAAAVQRNDTALLGLDHLREQVDKSIREATPPIAVIPFYLNPQMLMWPALYSCLCWIALIMTPDPRLTFRQELFSQKTLQLAVVTYVFYQWPLWFRNFVLSNEGRVVYGYPNVDVHVGSFIGQELIVFGFCLLLAVIWRQWAIYLAQSKHDDPSGNPGAAHLALLTDPEAAAAFAEVFFRWASCSVVLGLGFVGLTAFYWNLVGKYHDQRYLLSAILAHVLWGITWMVVSQPLVNEWRLWNRCRTYAYQVLAQEKEGESEEALRHAALIKNIEPVTGGTLAFANATSIVSFAIPVLQAFLR